MTDTEPKEIDKNADLKKKFLEYFSALPIQKLAASFIARHEDTILHWKKADQEFSDQIDMLKAEWAKNTAKRVRNPEWLLERIMRDTFKPPQQQTDITSGGKPIPILGGITNVQPDHSNKETNNTE